MKIDVNSTTWRAISAHLTDRLATCRERNDSEKLSESETAKLRGEIAAIKDLLALPQQVARVDVGDPGYGTDALDEA